MPEGGLMRPAPFEWWQIDPLPVPPQAPQYSTQWWRWRSRVTLIARMEREQQ